MLVTGIGAFILIKFGSFSLVGFSLVGAGVVVLISILIGIVGAARESSRTLKIVSLQSNSSRLINIFIMNESNMESTNIILITTFV